MLHQKNLFILSILFLSFSFGLTAQGTMFGVKGALVNSSFLGEDAQSTDNKTGYSAGVFLQIPTESGIFTLQPELVFTRKGATNNIGSVSESIELDYLDIPVLAKIGLPIGSLKPNIFAGPYASLKVREQYQVTEELTGATFTEEDQIRSWDYGAVFGGGLDFSAGNSVITVDARYNVGLAQLEEAEEPKDIKNGVFSLNLGIAFGL